jgi:outer membrane protein OmpA-like peptidoglycan-associated protein
LNLNKPSEFSKDILSKNFKNNYGFQEKNILKNNTDHFGESNSSHTDEISRDNQLKFNNDISSVNKEYYKDANANANNLKKNKKRINSNLKILLSKK